MFLKRKPRLVVTWTSVVLQIDTLQTYQKNLQKGFEFVASHNNLIDGILCHIAHLHTTLSNTNEHQWYQKNIIAKQNVNNHWTSTTTTMVVPNFCSFVMHTQHFSTLAFNNIRNYEMGIIRF
jgi:hypothetical protein